MIGRDAIDAMKPALVLTPISTCDALLKFGLASSRSKAE
jgi:hypothetical protein